MNFAQYPSAESSGALWLRGSGAHGSAAPRLSVEKSLGLVGQG